MGFVLINNKKEADRAVLSALNMPERQLVVASFFVFIMRRDLSADSS